MSPHKFISPCDDHRDDLDAYRLRYQRVALAQSWPQDKWPVVLSMCLTGEAVTIIGSMTAEDSCYYQKVKLALFCQFRFTAKSYNQFRNAKAADGGRGTPFIFSISGYFDRWIETAEVLKAFEGLRDKMIAEQFLELCLLKLVVFLK